MKRKIVSGILLTLLSIGMSFSTVLSIESADIESKRFLFFGCLHVGEISSREKNEFVNRVNALNPDYVFAVGDYVEHDGMCYRCPPENIRLHNDRIFNEYIDWILRNVSMYDDDKWFHEAGSGGHSGWNEREDYHDAYFRLLNETSLCYVVEVGNLAFVMIGDTGKGAYWASDGPNGLTYEGFSQVMAYWLQETTDELEQDGYSIFLLRHYPLYKTTAYTHPDSGKSWWGVNSTGNQRATTQIKQIVNNSTNVVMYAHAHVHLDAEEVDGVGRKTFYNYTTDVGDKYTDIETYCVNIGTASETLHSNWFVDYSTLWYMDVTEGSNTAELKGVRIDNGTIEKSYILPLSEAASWIDGFSYSNFEWSPCRIQDYYPEDMNYTYQEDYKLYVKAGHTAVPEFKFRFNEAKAVTSICYDIKNYSSLSDQIAYSDDGYSYSSWNPTDSLASLGIHEYWKLKTSITADPASDARIYSVDLMTYMYTCIYIRADGSIEPDSAPISTVDNITYTLTNNIVGEVPIDSYAIVVERDNIVVDGAGYTVQGTEEDGSTGIFLSGRSNVTIKNMEPKSFHFGIWLSESSNNTISGNNILNNECGINLYQSSNNTFYHNNFMNNMQQVYVEWAGFGHFWDDGYPSGGNFWSDCTGVDVKSGPYQNETGSDGIGDTPYTIDADNQDNYPLMRPWDDVESPVADAGPDLIVDLGTTVTFDGGKSSDDVAIKSYVWTFTDITPQTLTGMQPKYTFNNVGDFEVTLNVSDYAGNWNTDTVTITVLPEYTLTIYSSPTGTTFTVDDVSHITPWSGTYSEGASVSLIMPETHDEYIWSHWLEDGDTNRTKTIVLTDNTTWTGVFRFPADIDGSGVVDIVDITICALALWSHPGDPNWNLIADLNQDGTVDIIDLVTVAIHFWETW